MISINIVFGIFLAFIYSKLILPEKTGDSPKLNPTIYPIIYKGMIIIPFSKNKALHIHHWIISLMFSIYFYTNNHLLFWFFLGLLFQGLMYQDCYQIICKNPYI